VTSPFDSTKSCWIRFSLYEYTNQEIGDAHQTLKKEAVRSRWVGQSLGEQIWLLFEFEDSQERNKFVEHHPDLAPMYENQEFFDRWTTNDLSF
jgi:hypothetical protein